MNWFFSAAGALLVSSAAYSSDFSAYPQPLAEALAITYESPEDAVWHFTMDVTVQGDSMRVRFDGSQPDGSDWTLLSPSDPDALPEALADIWEDMNTPREEGEEAEGGVSIGGDGLFFDGETAAMVSGGIELIEGAAAPAYRFIPDLNPGEEEEDVMEEHLSAELTIAPAGYVQTIRIFAPESFKPNPAARVHTFEMAMEFDQVDGLPAPILTRMTTDVEVSALFQRQEQSIEFRFSDVEYVEP